ncbi:MAG: epimerase [Pseudomonadales bacterium]|nr:epimerase [Halioglobus sp.]MCP5121278.1 epimerase [Pseudomonadales bacterium]MCP5193382.1 epimerase [Pseudomonadales bacterium]
MKSNSILFVGCGDLGCRSGELLLDDGWQVAGLRRDIARLPEGVVGIAGDYTRAGELDILAALQPDFVVATFNPSDRSVEGYKKGFTRGATNLLAGLGNHRPRAILTVSSTRVYAERGGGWVDEASALAGDDPRALAMIAAERLLLESGHRCSVIRFAGIYGYPGGRLLERIRRGELSPQEPPRYSNRIHRDDCAGLLCHLLAQVAAGVSLAPVYNGVDDCPAAQSEVDSWLAAAMGLPFRAPLTAGMPAGTFQEATSAGHKRCSNRLLHKSGYRLRYPNYRVGYGAVLAAAGAATAAGSGPG